MMAKIATQRVTLQAGDGTTLGAYTARPSEEGKFPGILMFQEAFGVNSHIRDITERIAREGYVAIAPELFHRTAAPGFEGRYDDFPAVIPHYQAVTEATASHDIRAAHEWLRKDFQVAPDRIASIGFCMGGKVSFLACATVPLRAAISFYGGGIAQTLLPRVPDMAAPLLLFWGGLDKHIAPEHIRAIEDELRKEGKPHVTVNFSDADHGFFCDARPSYNATAASLAWNLSLAFLGTHMQKAGERARTAS